jgi:hypothetical protein
VEGASSLSALIGHLDVSGCATADIRLQRTVRRPDEGLSAHLDDSEASYPRGGIAPMNSLYTKNGRPLQVTGNELHSRSGKYLGRIEGNKVFDPRGRYVGSIEGDRVVYRSTDSASISSPSASANRAGSGAAPAAGSGIWGDEPNFPD